MTKWYLPKEHKDKVVWKSRKETEEYLKKTNPILYHIFKRHENMAEKEKK